MERRALDRGPHQAETRFRDAVWRLNRSRHTIAQHADPGYLHFNRIPGLQGPGDARSPCEDHVSRVERYVPARIAEDSGRIEQQFGEPARLHGFTVDTGPNLSFFPVEVGNDGRAEWCERIAPFCPPPLQIVLLPVAFADVVAARESENMLFSL